MILANYTFRDILTGNQVLVFEDNTCALSSMNNGRVLKEDMAHLTNLYHLQNFFLKIDSWHEWVPSAANIADAPSRPRFKPGSSVDEWAELLAFGAVQRQMRLPSEDQWDNLELWCDQFDSRLS